MSGRSLEIIFEREALKAKMLPILKSPKKYKVLILNDDYTPMEFVVEVLKQFFYMSEAVAVQRMLEVHSQGSAICGVYTRDIAETKVMLVNGYSRVNEHPLLCSMEAE